MPRSTNQPTQSTSSRKCPVPIRRGWLAVRTGHLFVLGSLLINLTMIAQGQETTTPGDSSRSQPPSAVGAAEPRNSIVSALDVDVDALRAETLERLKVFEPTVATHSVSSSELTRTTRPGGPITSPSSTSSTSSPIAAAPPSPSSDPMDRNSLPDLLRDRLIG